MIWLPEIQLNSVIANTDRNWSYLFITAVTRFKQEDLSTDVQSGHLRPDITAINVRCNREFVVTVIVITEFTVCN